MTSRKKNAERAIGAVMARANQLEPTYEERIDELRSHKNKLLEAKRKGLSAREIHKELCKNLPYHVSYKSVLAILHEAEDQLNGAQPKDGQHKHGETVVSKKTHSRRK